MRECAFTIVAKNYIGLAQILGQSLLQHQPETDFRIYVADEFAEIPATLPSNAIIAKNVLKGLTEKRFSRVKSILKYMALLSKTKRMRAETARAICLWKFRLAFPRCRCMAAAEAATKKKKLER